MFTRIRAHGVPALAATAFACLALLVPSAQAAAQSTQQPHIVGGHDASQSYPFVASMQTVDGGHSCGASLIDKQWLVTAAHCVAGEKPGAWRFRIGSPDRTHGGELAEPDLFIAHPRYDPSDTGDYDIALVHLAQPVHAQPIAVAAATPRPGDRVRELGWGLTCPVGGCGEPPRMLRELDTEVVDGSACTSPSSPFDPRRELCLDNHGGRASACYGDSGGPAVVADGRGWALVGATSRGQSESCPEMPGIYTNVVAHADWLRRTISAAG